MRDLSGNIRNLRDEADGGWIIRNYQIVNQAKMDEMAKKEADRALAAQAPSLAVVSSVAPDERNAKPWKIEELEKRIDSQDAKLDAILAALSPKRKKK